MKTSKSPLGDRVLSLTSKGSSEEWGEEVSPGQVLALMTDADQEDLIDSLISPYGLEISSVPGVREAFCALRAEAYEAIIFDGDVIRELDAEELCLLGNLGKEYLTVSLLLLSNKRAIRKARNAVPTEFVCLKKNLSRELVPLLGLLLE